MALNRCAIVLPMLLALPGAAGAQIVPPSVPSRDALRGVPVLDRATVQSVTARGARAQARPVPAGARLSGGALSSFDLRYLESDHKLRAVGVENRAPAAFLQLADKEPQDMFVGNASWLRARYFSQISEVRARGGGDFLLDLPPGPAGHVPLLAGFAFERAPGTDANIRTIAVQLVDGNKVRVALMDDQGADFRDFAPDVHGSIAMSGIPLVGGLLAGIYMTGRTAQEYGLFDGKRLRVFDVRVQVVWAPRAAVLGTDSVAGQTRRASSGTLPAMGDKVALRGFRFYFRNADHHLKSIGVKLQADGGADPVSFQDNGRDDPIAWSVEYARMR